MSPIISEDPSFPLDWWEILDDNKSEKICSVQFCWKQRRGKKLHCKSHYEQNRIHGNPLFSNNKIRPVSPPGYRTCRDCCAVRAVSECLKGRNVCRSCDRARSTDRREKNPEYNRKYYKDNPEYFSKYRESKAEAIREAQRRWRANNPDKNREYSRNRRAARRGSISDGHTDSDIIRAYGEFCYLCGIRVWDKNRLSIFEEEHVIPLSRGGHDVLKNVRPSCITCNRSKMHSSLIWFLWRRTDKQLRLGELNLSESDEEWYAEHCRELANM